ncbi:MAG: 4Fe-4S binding protein [Prevotella sp.]|nr:4Fe-4S binding protein [Prevotella sp.]
MTPSDNIRPSSNAKRRFHRHFPTKGLSFYWILFAYLIIGWFYPVIGFVALICMIGPVLTSIWRGRYWCGHICPRGNMYDRLLSKYSPHRPIPKFVRTFGFRLFMVFFIFTMFGIQFYLGWGDWNAMGKVFWNIILLTTVVGVVLSFIYAPRTWCSFCPMGTISSWVAPKKAPFPKGFKRIHVSSACQMKCKSCARVCPMQLAPYECRGQEQGYLHADCIKCGKCVQACPTKIMEMKS